MPVLHMPRRLKPLKTIKNVTIQNAPRRQTNEEVEVIALRKDSTDMVKLWNGKSWFYVNRSGFPMSDSAYEKMWKYAEMNHPDGPDLRNRIKPVDVPMPKVPLCMNPLLPVSRHLETVQKYLLLLEYNYTGTQFFDIRKDRPYSGLMDSARCMIRDSLPIKCLEAVILCLYLTNQCSTLDRFPISFISVSKGSVFHHVVLGVCHGGRYGAMGISRREDLMYKQLNFKNLSQLIENFIESYRKNDHTVKRVRIGLCAPHDPTAYESLTWSAFSYTIEESTEDNLYKEIEKYSRRLRTQSVHWKSMPADYHAPKPPSSGSAKRKRNSLSTLTVSKTVKKNSAAEKAESIEKSHINLPAISLTDSHILSSTCFNKSCVDSEDEKKLGPWQPLTL